MLLLCMLKMGLMDIYSLSCEGLLEVNKAVELENQQATDLRSQQQSLVEGSQDISAIGNDPTTAE